MVEQSPIAAHNVIDTPAPQPPTPVPEAGTAAVAESADAPAIETRVPAAADHREENGTPAPAPAPAPPGVPPAQEFQEVAEERRHEPAPAAEATPPVEGEATHATSGDDAVPVAEVKEEEAAPPSENNKHWYVVKVQSGREESIKEAIERRVKIEGLEEYFAQIIIPVERVTEVRNNKRVVKEKKLYPGYLMVEVEYNDQILYLFRETSGVGDFVGGGLNHPPQPMKPKEVERMIGAIPDTGKEIHHKPKFDKGDRVRVRDGTFAGMEGEIKDILEAKGSVRVELTIFGRGVPVELEYWQVEQTS